MILFTIFLVPLLHILGCQVSNEIYDTVYGIVDSSFVIDLSEYFSGESNYYFLDGPGQINQITSSTYLNLNYNIVDFSLQNIMNDPLVQKGGQIAILGQDIDNYYVILDNTITNYTTLNSVSFPIQNDTQCFQIAFMNFNASNYVIVSCSIYNITVQQQFLVFNQSKIQQTPKVIAFYQNISQIVNQTIQTTQEQQSDFYFIGVLSYTSNSSICYIYNISNDLNIQIYTYIQNVSDFYISSNSDIFILNQETGITINYNNNQSVNFNPYPNQYLSFDVFELLVQPTVSNYYLGIATTNGMSTTLIIDNQFTTTTFYSWGYQGYQEYYQQSQIMQSSILITPQYLIGSNGYSLIIYPGPRNLINNQQSLFNVHLAAQVKLQYNLQLNYLYIGLINENIWGSNQLINPYYIDIPTLSSLENTIKINVLDVFGNKCNILLKYNVLYQTDMVALPTRSKNVPLIVEDYKTQSINLNKYYCGPSIQYPSITFSESTYFSSVSLQQYGQIQLVSNNPTYAQLFAPIEIGYLPSIILMEYYNENPQIDISVCQPTYQYCKLFQSIFNSTYTTINSLAVGSNQQQLVVAINLGILVDIYQVNLNNVTFITTLTTGSTITNLQIAGGYIFIISTPSIVYQLSDYQQLYKDDASVQINNVFWNYEAYGNQFFINSENNCNIIQISQNNVIIMQQINQPILGITKFGYYYLNITDGTLMFQSRISIIPPISLPIYDYTLQSDFVGYSMNHFYIMATKDGGYYLLVYQISNSIYGVLYLVLPLPLQPKTIDIIGQNEFDILLILIEGGYTTYILYPTASLFFVPIIQFHPNEEIQASNLIITTTSLNLNPYEQYIKLAIIDPSTYINRYQIDEILLIPRMPDSLLYIIQPNNYIKGNIYNYQIQYDSEQLNAILINPINPYQQYNGILKPLGVNFYNYTYIVNNSGYYVFNQDGPSGMSTYQEIFNISQFLDQQKNFINNAKVVTSFIEFQTKFAVLVFQTQNEIKFQGLNLDTYLANPTYISAFTYTVQNLYYMNGIVLIYSKNISSCYLQVGVYVSYNETFSDYYALNDNQLLQIPCISIYAPLNISMGVNISSQNTQQFGFLTYDYKKFEITIYSFIVIIGNISNQEQIKLKSYQQSFTLIELVGNNDVSQVYDIIQIDYPSFTQDFYNIVPLLLTSEGFSYQVNLQFINGKNQVIINPIFNCYFQGYEMNIPTFVQASNGIVAIVYQLKDNNYDSIFNYGNYSEQCSSGSTVYSIAYSSTIAPNQQYLSIYVYPYLQLIGANQNQGTQMNYLSPELNIGILPVQQQFQGQSIQFNVTVHSLYNYQAIQVFSDYTLIQGTTYIRPSSSEWAFLWGSILFLAIVIPIGLLCWKSRS